MSQDVKNKLRTIIANNVQIQRNNRKISREKLSLLINMDNSYISKLEKCRINATLDSIEKIANALEIDSLELFKL